MRTTMVTTTKANTNPSRSEKKSYPKTLKGCFSFEEFQDLLNEKIREHTFHLPLRTMTKAAMDETKIVKTVAQQVIMNELPSCRVV